MLLGTTKNRPDVGPSGNYHSNVTVDARGGTPECLSSIGEEIPAWGQRQWARVPTVMVNFLCQCDYGTQLFDQTLILMLLLRYFIDVIDNCNQ